ncbi:MULTISPECIES: penicillin-binding protein 2 [Desulfococcus]|nr:penicillin-binding protein 2 [Desulfococcus multivorans]AOY57980.1 MrdA: penicillin-binding protein 2 [Desulfococcus multivorans]
MILFVRLFYLQVVEGEEFRRLSQNNCIRLRGISPSRGIILDRNGSILVDNRPSFNLSIISRDAKPVAETLERLLQYVHIPEERIAAVLDRQNGAKTYDPVLLKKDMNRDELAAVEVHKFDLPGIVVDIQPKRHYISRHAAHLIGYLGEISLDELKSGRFPGSKSGDYVGKYGVERTAETYLKGKAGGKQVEVNARGQVVRTLLTVDPVSGDNLWLTIDIELQKKAEVLMDGLVGAVVAIRPDSGEILAMVSSPSFNQSGFVDGMSREEWRDLVSNPFHPLQNKAINGEYPPASTYKIVTAMAGLEEGVIDAHTTFFCPGYYPFGDRIFRCWRKGGHGAVNVQKALAVSCDVFFYQTGQRLGVDRLARHAGSCGLGQPTGVALSHESSGLIPTSAWKKKRFGIPWQKGETLSIAIGQGYNLATPLQMAVLAAAIANGGTLYRPEIIKKRENALGEIVYECKKEAIRQLPVSAGTLEILKKGLWDVVNSSHGTARLARIDGIDVSGKTGTAQVFSRKNEDTSWKEITLDHLKPHAWFIAYGARHPDKIAVSVIVEHGEHGSGTAAPIAREVIRAYFNQASKGNSASSER